VVDGGEPGVDSRDEGKHTGRNERRFKLFGHVTRADQAEDHNRALRASLNPPSNWRRPRGRLRQTWHWQ